MNLRMTDCVESLRELGIRSDGFSKVRNLIIDVHEHAIIEPVSDLNVIHVNAWVSLAVNQ